MKILNKYITRRSEASDDKIITKDRAFLASRQLLEHFRKLTGRSNSKFLDQNFKSVWDDHDTAHNNFIVADDASAFADDLVAVNGGSSSRNDDD